MWGFFESVLKIGFGVAFGFLVYDTAGPLASIFGSWYGLSSDRISDGFPVWIWPVIYPFAFSIFSILILFGPMALLLPLRLIWPKLVDWSDDDLPSWLDSGEKEFYCFVVIWSYGFWAMLLEFAVISKVWR